MRQVRFLLKGKHQLSSTHPIENLVGFVEEEDIGKFVAAILAPSDNTTTYLGQTINGISELAKPTLPILQCVCLWCHSVWHSQHEKSPRSFHFCTIIMRWHRSDRVSVSIELSLFSLR